MAVCIGTGPRLGMLLGCGRGTFVGGDDDGDEDSTGEGMWVEDREGEDVAFTSGLCDGNGTGRV